MPDGYTMLVHSNGFVTVPAIQAIVPYDPVKDFAALTPLGNVPMVLVVVAEQGHEDGARSWCDKAKARLERDQLRRRRHRHAAASDDGALSASRGLRGAACAVQGRARGADRGDGRPRRYVLLSDLDRAAADPGGQARWRSRCRSAKRASALPDVPTTIEAGVPDSDFDFWVGAMVPKKTPRDVIARMHAETVKALRVPAVQEKLAKIGVEQMIMEPAAFDARIEKEVDMARKLAKAANIQPQ